MRRELRWTPAGELPPANWFAPPGGNRSRLFLSNEKQKGFRCGQHGRTSSFAGGERRLLLTAVTNVIVRRAMSTVSNV